MIKVKCIDDSNRPADIPLSSWITKGEYYTVVNAFYGFGGVLIFQLAERDLTPFPPYKGFDAKRFGAVEDKAKTVTQKELVYEDT
jgi:hypothetical protein